MEKDAVMAHPRDIQILREIEKRLAAGIEAAVQRAAEGYEKRVTDEQSPPTSDPGEYPHEDTGQGAANISYGVQQAADGGEVEGRFGLFGENSPIPQFPGQDHTGGEHLDWLRENQQRLGMDSSFAEDLEAVKRAFRRGARSL
jgi:hypothetical protein